MSATSDLEPSKSNFFNIRCMGMGRFSDPETKKLVDPPQPMLVDKLFLAVNDQSKKVELVANPVLSGGCWAVTNLPYTQPNSDFDPLAINSEESVTILDAYSFKPLNEKNLLSGDINKGRVELSKLETDAKKVSEAARWGSVPTATVGDGFSKCIQIKCLSSDDNGNKNFLYGDPNSGAVGLVPYEFGGVKDLPHSMLTNLQWALIDCSQTFQPLGLDIKDDWSKASPLAYSLVQNQLKSYGEQSFKEPMGNLSNIGDILRVALAGADLSGMTYGTVTEIMIAYQEMLSNAVKKLPIMKAQCDLAFLFHQDALKMINSHDLSVCIDKVGSTLEYVETIRQSTADLIKSSEELCDKTTDAIQKVADNKDTTEKQKNEIKELIAKNKALKAGLDSDTENLRKQISNTNSDYQDMLKKQEKSENRAFILGMVSVAAGALSGPLSAAQNTALDVASDKTATSTSPQGMVLGSVAGAMKKQMDEQKKENESKKKNLQTTQQELAKKQAQLDALKKKENPSDNDKKQIETLTSDVAGLKKSEETQKNDLHGLQDSINKMQDMFQKQAESAQKGIDQIRQRKYDLEDQQLKVTRELAEASSKLGSLASSKDHLALVISSLRLTLAALTQVSVAFKKMDQYWNAIQSECQVVKDVAGATSKEDQGASKIIFMNYANSCALRWATLKSLIDLGIEPLQVAEKHFDNKFTKPPASSEDALSIIEKDGAKLGIDFKDVADKMEKEIKNKQKEAGRN